MEVFEVRAGTKEFVVRTVYLSGFGDCDLNIETLETSWLFSFTKLINLISFLYLIKKKKKFIKIKLVLKVRLISYSKHGESYSWFDKTNSF